MVTQLFDALAALPQVEAIALGGSRAGQVYDETSDYDVYLYCTAPVTPGEKLPILQKYCSYIEAGNHFWELEDNCTLKNGIDIDILYRSIDDFTKQVAAVVEGHQAYNGYTTCMWHNLRTCRIVYDKDGRLATLKQRFDVPYPPELKQNIIENNMKLLYDYMPAYYLQIKKALGRGDLVSVNHRTAAFLESYFDIIWAMNELTHPGEKRLTELTKASCTLLPADFEENLNTLFAHLFTHADIVMNTLERMVTELKAVLK